MTQEQRLRQMPEAEGLRVLLIEDDDDHAELIEHALRGRPGFLTRFERQPSLASGLESLGPDFDLLMLDLSLPDSTTAQTLGRLPELSKQSAAPIVVLTSLDDAHTGQRAIQAGAQDFLAKDPASLSRLIDSARYARERHALRIELERAHGELARSNRDLERFGYVASHDLQEPLRTVKALCGVVGEEAGEQLSSEAQRALALMQDSLDRMAKMVRDLMEFARLGRSTEFETVDLAAIARLVVRDLEAAIAGAGARVVLHPLPTLAGRKTELRLLLQNLVANAIKFSKPSQAPEVVVHAAQKGDHYQLTVRDNGIGIAEQDQQSIFELFSRLQTGQEYAGMGLGLAQCQRVVEAHGGRLWVESEAGQGCAFHATLQRTAPEPPAALLR